MLELSAHAMKLFFDVLAQYDGYNNGDMCLAWSVMKTRGWSSRDTLAKARAELLASGVLEISRQGGRHKATLYALSIFAVNDCKGKLDIAATRAPKSLWRETENPPEPLCAPQPDKNRDPPGGSISHSMTRPACQ
jgi:hypothetical protein